MTQDTEALSLTTCTEHRLIRIGACPVLEVTVTYPQLCSAGLVSAPELSPAVIRFNEAYRTMAAHFLAWSQEAPAAAAREDFYTSGAGAAYRFDRRVISCDMAAAYAPTEEGTSPTVLLVTRTARAGSRRGEAEEKSLEAVDVWRLPELTLCPPRRRRRIHGSRGDTPHETVK